MNVILPQAGKTLLGDAPAKRKTYPVLWLLHGMSDDHTIWQRRTSIERYADALGIAVVMPAVARSYYTDMASGLPYWTFISEELPAVARSFFPLSDRREDNFVAGLSMGGYGAFKLALRCPERYAAAASLSGALDVAVLAKRGSKEWMREKRLVFGNLDKLSGSDNDLLALAEKLAAARGPKPRLFQWCGTEDFLYPDNLTFRDHALKLGLDLTYEEGPGTHQWQYWDTMIQRVLEWLPLKPTLNPRPPSLKGRGRKARGLWIFCPIWQKIHINSFSPPRNGEGPEVGLNSAILSKWEKGEIIIGILCRSDGTKSQIILKGDPYGS